MSGGILNNGWSAKSQPLTRESLQAAFDAVRDAPPSPPHSHIVSGSIKREDGAKAFCACGTLIVNDGGTLREAKNHELPPLHPYYIAANPNQSHEEK